MLMVKRGNLQKELNEIGEQAGEGTEIQNITLFKLMKSFEKVMQRLNERQNKPVHTVVRYKLYNGGKQRLHVTFYPKRKNSFILKKFLMFVRVECMAYFFFFYLC